MAIGRIFQSLFGRDVGDYPHWPALPRTGVSRQGFEVVLVAVFSMLGALMKAKKISTKDSLKSIKDFGAKALNLNGPDELLSINIFTKAHHGQGNLFKALDRFAAYSEGSEKLRRAAFESLLHFHTAYPQQSDEVDEVLKIVADVLELDHEADEIQGRKIQESQERQEVERERVEKEADAVKRLRTKVKEVTASALDRSYLALGCAAEDPPPVIEARYKKLVFELHPDRARGRGESPEKVEEYHERYRAVLKAFSTIRRTWRADSKRV